MSIKEGKLDIHEWSGDAVSIKVDFDKCVAHGNCVEACPSDVYELQNGNAVPVVSVIVSNAVHVSNLALRRQSNTVPANDG